MINEYNSEFKELYELRSYTERRKVVDESTLRESIKRIVKDNISLIARSYDVYALEKKLDDDEISTSDLIDALDAVIKQMKIR